ncbi:MAG: class I SAM-dependent methyltransferase [Solirubrobacterales bacterium]|nr:class I SAM-dependent methyltransferase [Solirubrobacterales bacterium]
MTPTPIDSPAAAPDFAAVKTRQQAMWASGDYSAVAATIHVIAERLADHADLVAGTKVLDVATGSGNAALAAARYGCEVTGIDYVPALLERARRRAEAEGLDIDLLEADAEALPFADASFDAVLSVVGVMFAPDQAKAAAELVRVCRPGGTIALASWTPDSFIGRLLRTVGAHVPPPAGVASPIRWGDEEVVRELFGDEVASLHARERTYTFRFASAASFVDFFLTHYGPTHKAFEALDADGRAALRADLEALAADGDRRKDGGAVAIPASYLEVVATRA